MPKVNYSKVEKAIDKAAQKILIDSLFELATIVTVIQDPFKKISSEQIEAVIKRFQKELKKLKKNDPVLYKKLELSTEDESHFQKSSTQFSQEDWIKLRSLKEKIEGLKSELYGEEIFNLEFEKQVSIERRKHINKRFNVKEGWLPLH